MSKQGWRSASGVLWLVGTICGAVCGVGASVVAAQPADTPPADVGGTFVDRTGCAWQRVVIGEEVSWAALIAADGAQLCGLAPTVAASAPVDATASDAEATAQSAEPAPAAVTKWTQSASKAKRPNFPQPGYYVQIGAFSRADYTERAIGFLQGKGFSALQATYRGRTPLQVIYAGPFASRAEADIARRAARQNGYRDAFIWDPA